MDAQVASGRKCGCCRGAIQVKHMHTVPSWDDRDPAEFRTASLTDLERYGCVTVRHVEIESVKKHEDGTFEATAGGRSWTGKKLLLATGVEGVFLGILGYADYWVPAMQIKAPERSQIVLEFDNGSTKTEAFLAHKPKTRLRGSPAQQLGLELTPMGMIKVNPPFNQTTVEGVFATGDCSSPMQTDRHCYPSLWDVYCGRGATADTG